MKKKIVFITEAMLGGVRQHLCDVMENLDNNQFEIYMIYSSRRADEGFYKKLPTLEKAGIHFISCDEMQRELGLHDFAAYRKIVKLLKQIRPDIVHCHSSKAGIVGRMAAKRCRVNRILYTPHAYAFQNPDNSTVKRRIYILAEQFLSRYATELTINVSKGERQEALKIRMDKKNKLKVVYNGIPQLETFDRKEIRRRLGLKDNIYYVGVTARCTKQKDPFTFLKIAEKVVHQRNNVEFLYIGDGNLQEQMEDWIRDRNLQEKIHLPGFRSDAAEAAGAFDLYLSTSVYEGLPYSILEAMRAGVPVVATDVTGNNELIENEVNGLLFRPGSAEQGAELVIRQIEEGTIRHEKVTESFNARFSLEKMMKELTQIMIC